MSRVYLNNAITICGNGSRKYLGLIVNISERVYIRYNILYKTENELQKLRKYINMDVAIIIK